MAVVYWPALLLTHVCVLLIVLPSIYHFCLAYISSQLWAPAVHYDYIVVGSGSAGSVVAGRLAGGGHRVLLVEAGGPAPALAHIPGMVAGLQRSVLDWSYRTEQQDSAVLSSGGVSIWPRGKVLGGSSILNYMLYMRGHSRDYDEWRDAGLEGWGYQDVLQYFKRSEQMESDIPDKEKFHGTDGELTVTKDNFKEPIIDVYMKAAEELGYKVGDINGELEDEGFSPSQVSLRNGVRTGTYKAFAEKESSNNLTVLTFAHASKLLFEGKTAVGVEVIRFGKTQQFFSSQEVIVSAGSIGSPQLLMLSGIGDKHQLEKVGVKPFHHLPEVGRNLQDHLLVPVCFDTPDPLSIQLEDSFLPSSWSQYLSGSGPLTSTGGLPGVAHINTKQGGGRPDVQLHLLALTGATDFGLLLKDNLGLTEEAWPWQSPHSDKYSNAIAPTLSRPKSRGELKLRSKDPFDHPVIKPNYLSEQEDVDTLVAGIKVILNMFNTTAMREAGAELWQVLF